MTRWVDFDIHGLIGIRLVSPSPEVEAAVRRHLGPMQKPLLHEPDVTIRFVKWLPASGLRFLGRNQYAFNDDAFFLLSGNRRRAKIQIPFDRLGTPCEIVCEEDVDELPLLIDLVRVLAVAKGCAPIHGAAFIHEGQSILLSSWAKGGKTTALLGFLSLGGEFVADDCLLLSGDGKTIYGLPTPVEISGRHLSAMPSLRHRIGMSERARMAALRYLRMTQNPLASFTSAVPFVARAWQRVLSGLERRSSVLMPPQRAFGYRLEFRAPAPDKIFVLMSHPQSTIEVECSSPSNVVPSLVSAALQEQNMLTEHHRAFRFAFPHKANPLIERAGEFQRGILSRALRGKSCYIVRHPYPISFPAFYEAVHPYCAETPVSLLRITPSSVKGEAAVRTLRPTS